MSLLPDTPGGSARRLMIIAVGVVLAVVVGCTTASEVSAPAAGLGDSYFPTAGNSGYQVEHYDLRVRYDPDSQQLAGQATIDLVITEPVDAVSFDLSGLTVDTVALDGVDTTHRVGADKLTVDLPGPAVAGDALAVTVTYGGVPEPVNHPQLGSNGFHHTGDGAFAIGQPRSASTWFPVNEHPRDKASYAIAVTVPEGLAAVSNGVPAGQHTDSGWTTWQWSERTPMASYTVTLAVGDYRVQSSTHADGRPVVVAVHEDLPAAIDEQLRRTPEIADVLAGWFGPYPVDAYGGIALADERIGFALETQSRPIYGPGFFLDGAGGIRDATGVIVHELAHQWFGNSVSVYDWRDIWLNEGFATYAEWLWSEHDGDDTTQEIFELYWDGPGAEDAFWARPPGDPGPARLFDPAVYLRGAMTLHALRLQVGDDAFFAIVRAWAAEHRDGTATTAELVTLAERISGQPLRDLFDAWLYREQRPPRP